MHNSTDATHCQHVGLGVLSEGLPIFDRPIRMRCVEWGDLLCVCDELLTKCCSRVRTGVVAVAKLVDVALQ